MKLQITKIIKLVSTIAIIGALGLTLTNIYLQLQDKSLPDNLNGLLWLAAIALIAHLIEGAIAMVKIDSGDRNPLAFGIYTFFVGYVGLKELSDSRSNNNTGKNV